VGRQLGLVLDVVVSDGRQPVGRGIGPVLEARDVMAVLHNDPGAPLDLRQKALRLAGRVIEFSPDVPGGEGYAIARDILDSGRALAKMEAIVAAQGARDFDWRHPPLAPLSFEVTAPTAGRLAAYDNEGLARIARLAGAPKSPGAGVDLIVTPGATLRAGDPLYRVHAQYASELEFARERVARDPASTLDPA
jgi:thymidine phosphorylase